MQCILDKNTFVSIPDELPVQQAPLVHLDRLPESPQGLPHHLRHFRLVLPQLGAVRRQRVRTGGVGGHAAMVGLYRRYVGRWEVAAKHLRF